MSPQARYHAANTPLSAYTQSPGWTVTPAIVTGTSDRPGSRLLLLSGYVPRAFTPSGILAMSSLSRIQPLMMTPCHTHKHKTEATELGYS